MFRKKFVILSFLLLISSCLTAVAFSVVTIEGNGHFQRTPTKTTHRLPLSPVAPSTTKQGMIHLSPISHRKTRSTQSESDKESTNCNYQHRNVATAINVSKQQHDSPRQALRSLALAMIIIIILTTVQSSSPVNAEPFNDSITSTRTSVVALEPGNAPLPSSSSSSSSSSASSFSTLTTSALPLPSLFQPIQFQTVDDVPRSYFDTHQSIYALVERVIDGDTLRVRHIPGYRPWWFRSQPPQPLQKRGIADETLSIRIYGVDCPEIGKNKRETSQPFAEQAKDFTSDLVLHQMVKITFLRRDQYRRAVAVVETVPSSPSALFCSWIPGRGAKDLSVELARRGLAELYTGGGAEYNNNRKLLEDKIALAKRERRGVWAQGEQRISAAEYKRQKKQQEAAEVQGVSQMGAPAVAAGHRALTGLQA